MIIINALEAQELLDMIDSDERMALNFKMKDVANYCHSIKEEFFSLLNNGRCVSVGDIEGTCEDLFQNNRSFTTGKFTDSVSGRTEDVVIY